MKKKKTTEGPLELETLPGHYIRRLQQIAVAVFLQETEAHGLTPVQYAALNQVERTPGVDQRTLSRLIGQDTSTTASVIDRLEARGLMRRQVSPNDRRVRLLELTEEGSALLAAAAPDIVSAQERMLHPLTAAEREEFMRMLRAIVAANKELTRVAGDG